MEIIISTIVGGLLGWCGWRLISGKWIPDGSFSASQAPSGIDWQKVGKAINDGKLDEVRKHPEQFRV